VRPKYLICGLTFPSIVALDIWTKRWALEALAIQPSELFGGLLPLTLAFNKGAAFGMRVGDDSRWFFVPVTIVALALLGVLYKQALASDFLRISSISLVVSGAVGNLIDRVRWDRGVVDFLGPVDLGLWNFPIFNVADMAITCGAVLLAISFWIEERQERQREAAAADTETEGAEAEQAETADTESVEVTEAEARSPSVDDAPAVEEADPDPTYPSGA
jgi:signal peptidase II